MSELGTPSERIVEKIIVVCNAGTFEQHWKVLGDQLLGILLDKGVCCASNI